VQIVERELAKQRADFAEHYARSNEATRALSAELAEAVREKEELRMQVGSLTSRALCISLCQGYACERLQGICLPGPGANRGFFADGLLAGRLQVESLKRGGDGQSLVAQRLAEESAANAKRVEQVGPAPHESGGGAPALRAAKSPPPTTATADPNPESRGGPAARDPPFERRWRTFRRSSRRRSARRFRCGARSTRSHASSSACARRCVRPATLPRRARAVARTLRRARAVAQVRREGSLAEEVSKLREPPPPRPSY